MIKAIFSESRQVLNKSFYFGITAVIVLIFLSSLESLIQIRNITVLQQYGYHTEFVFDAIQTDIVLSFIPLIASLPFAACYIDEIKSKFVRHILFRSNYRTYIFSRITACYISGGCTIVIGIMLAWFLSALFFLPIESAPQGNTATFRQVFPIFTVIFSYSGFWAVVGMTMSTLIESKYIAYASPFILYYLLVILCKRYYPNIFFLYPPNWINLDLWPFSVWGAVVFLWELTILFMITFVVRAERRLREL